MVLTPFLFTLLIFNNVQRLFRHFLSRPSSFFMWTDWFELSRACNVWSKFAIRHPEAKKAACEKDGFVSQFQDQLQHRTNVAKSNFSLLLSSQLRCYCSCQFTGTWFSLLPSRNCSVIIKVARVCYQLRVAQRLVSISKHLILKRNFFSNAL